MSAKTDGRSMYSKIIDDPFPNDVEISFGSGESRQRLFYEKVTWDIEGSRLGLRYGENPDQPAALYRLVNGNLSIGDVTSLEPGQYLMSDVELLQSGKHPGKINITDVDNALGMLRYFTDKPAAIVVKHNNPAGAAIGGSISEAYHRALMADRIAAFGGAVVCNRAIDRETATEIANGYTEVVAAPEFLDGCFDILCSATEVSRGKPAPDLFELAAERLGVAPGDGAVIEDSVFGLQAATAAGMRALGFTSSHTAALLRDAGAEATFDHYRELPALLGTDWHNSA